MTQAVENG